MLDHRGFSAYITTNGLELVEFEPRINQQTHTVTCWIAGPVGQVRRTVVAEMVILTTLHQPLAFHRSLARPRQQGR